MKKFLLIMTIAAIMILPAAQQTQAASPKGARPMVSHPINHGAMHSPSMVHRPPINHGAMHPPSMVHKPPINHGTMHPNTGMHRPPAMANHHPPIPHHPIVPIRPFYPVYRPFFYSSWYYPYPYYSTYMYYPLTYTYIEKTNTNDNDNNDDDNMQKEILTKFTGLQSDMAKNIADKSANINAALKLFNY